MEWARMTTDERLVWLTRGTTRGGWSSALLYAACTLSGCAGDDRAPRAGGPDVFIDPSVTEDAGGDNKRDSGNDGGSDGGTIRPDSGTFDAGPVEPRPDAPPWADPTTERLVVSDGQQAKVFVIDAENGQEVAHLEVAASATVTRSPSGRYALLTSPSDTGMRVLDVGLVLSRDPSGQLRPLAQAPALVPLSVAGLGPRTPTVGGGSVGVSFAREPKAVFFGDDSLPGMISPSVIDVGMAHDGVAFAVGKTRFVSTMDDATPEGRLHEVTAQGRVGTLLADCNTPREAVVQGGTAVVSCAQGTVWITTNGDAYTAKFVAYPSSSAADARVSNLHARPGSVESVGAFGAASLLRVTATGSEAIAVSGDTVALSFLPAGDKLAVLNAAGKLQLLDAQSLQPAAEAIDLGCAISNSAALRPELVVGTKAIFVSCPAKGVVHAISLGEDGPTDTAYNVGTAPTHLALFRFEAAK